LALRELAEVRLELARRDWIEAFANAPSPSAMSIEVVGETPGTSNAAARLDLCQGESREAPKACGGALLSISGTRSQSASSVASRNLREM
jgi:hypothetical protein